MCLVALPTGAAGHAAGAGQRPPVGGGCPHARVSEAVQPTRQAPVGLFQPDWERIFDPEDLQASVRSIANA